MTDTPIDDDEYRILDLFAKGAEAPAIADQLGSPWRVVDVSHVLNKRCKRSRSDARKLLDSRKPPESPLTAPIAVPKAKVEPPLPPRLAEEPVPVPAAPTANMPDVPIDDLDSMDGVLAAGRDHSLHTIRTATAKAASMLADVRNQIIAERQETAVRSRIADLEAELLALRGLVAA